MSELDGLLTLIVGLVILQVIFFLVILSVVDRIRAMLAVLLRGDKGEL